MTNWSTLILGIASSLVVSFLGIALIVASLDIKGTIGLVIFMSGIAMTVLAGVLLYDVYHNKEEQLKNWALSEIHTIAKSEDSIAWARVKIILDEVEHGRKTCTR